jgi:hypothetical protein
VLNNHCHRVTTQLQLINIIIIIIIIIIKKATDIDKNAKKIKYICVSSTEVRTKSQHKVANKPLKIWQSLNIWKRD